MTAIGHTRSLPQTAVRPHGRTPGGNGTVRQQPPARAQARHTGRRIPVTVHAPDPVSLAGLGSHLGQHPEFEVLPRGQERPGTVAVLLAETVDGAALLRLRHLVRADGVRAVLVAGAIGEAELLDVVECGVGTVLWRHETTPQRLHQAVLAAWRDEGSLPADLLTRLINRMGRTQRGTGGEPDAPAGLTSREIDVVRLIAEGLDTKEVAGRLSYSERTVKNVLHGMTTRLRLRNRTHAVAYALREGYI